VSQSSERSRFSIRLQGGAGQAVGGAHRTDVTRWTTQPLRREGALVRGVSGREKDQANGVRLATPDKIRRLQEARGTTAKQAPTDRFSLRYDTVHRADLLA
jgi:hypothetical protein